MKGLTGLIGLVGSVCLASLLTGCPGGGEDGGAAPAPVAAPAPTMVSGNVQAPAGQIAFYRESSIGELFVSAAYAALTGLAPVPDNTIVQLARLNATLPVSTLSPRRRPREAGMPSTLPPLDYSRRMI